FDDDLSHFRWALATADSYRRIGLDFLAHDRPDVLMVYIEGTDSVSHLFGHLVRAEGLKGELAAQQQRYGGAVESMYRWADRLVGEYIAAMDERTTLVVLSDHGFSLGELPDDPSRTRDMRRVSERFHRIEGILYLFGHRVRAGRQIEKPVLVDVAPTLLALAGVAPAQDMPGRVLSEALDLGKEPSRIASYESAPRPADAAAAAEPAVDDAIIKRLESLGYLDASSPSADRSPRWTSRPGATPRQRPSTKPCSATTRTTASSTRASPEPSARSAATTKPSSTSASRSSNARSTPRRITTEPPSTRS